MIRALVFVDKLPGVRIVRPMPATRGRASAFSFHYGGFQQISKVTASGRAVHSAIYSEGSYPLRGGITVDAPARINLRFGSVFVREE